MIMISCIVKVVIMPSVIAQAVLVFDTLTPIVEVGSDYNIMNQLQNTDEILSLCFSYVHCKTDFGVDTLQSYHRHWKHLHIVNCLLYYNDEIVVPSALHNSIMQLCRNHSTSEYFSVDRTPDQIKQSFFWPNVHNFIVQWIKSWPQCNEFAITIPKLVQTACSTSHNK